MEDPGTDVDIRKAVLLNWCVRIPQAYQFAFVRAMLHLNVRSNNTSHGRACVLPNAGATYPAKAP